MPANFSPTDVVKLNKDRLYMLPREQVATDALTILDPIGGEPAHRQLAAVAMVFNVLCSRFGVDPADMHAYAGRVLRDQQFHKKGNAQVDALIAYANLHQSGQVPT